MTNRVTLNLVASALVGIAGLVVVFYGVGFFARTGITMWTINAIGDSAWLTPSLWLQDLIMNVILSLPAAAVLCLLKPRRLAIYTLCAVLASFLLWNWNWIDPVNWPSLSTFARTTTLELFTLPLAVLLIRRRIGGLPPNKTLERTTPAGKCV